MSNKSTLDGAGTGGVGFLVNGSSLGDLEFPR